MKSAANGAEQNAPAEQNPQEETRIAEKSGFSNTVGECVAEVLAGHFAESIAGFGRSMPPQDDKAVPDPPKPPVCGRQVQAGLHAYERD